MSIKTTQYITREEAIEHLAEKELKKEMRRVRQRVMEKYEDYTNRELGDMMDANPYSIFENYIVIDNEKVN